MVVQVMAKAYNLCQSFGRLWIWSPLCDCYDVDEVMFSYALKWENLIVLYCHRLAMFNLLYGTMLMAFIDKVSQNLSR